MVCAPKSKKSGSAWLHCFPRTTTEINNPYRFSSGCHDFLNPTLLSAGKVQNKLAIAHEFFALNAFSLCDIFLIITLFYRVSKKLR